MSTEWTTLLPVLAQSAATLLALLAWANVMVPCADDGTEGERPA